MREKKHTLGTECLKWADGRWKPHIHTISDDILFVLKMGCKIYGPLFHPNSCMFLSQRLPPWSHYQPTIVKGYLPGHVTNLPLSKATSLVTLPTYHSQRLPPWSRYQPTIVKGYLPGHATNLPLSKATSLVTLPTYHSHRLVSCSKPTTKRYLVLLTISAIWIANHIHWTWTLCFY